MSSESRKKFIGKTTLIALIIGILVGGSAIWLVRPSPEAVSLQAKTAPALAGETAQAPSIPAKPATLPSGWDTEWSQKLDIKLLAQFDSSGPPAWDAAKHPLVYISSNGPGYGGFLSGIQSPGLVIIDANTYEVVLTKQYTVEGIKNYFEPHGSGASMDGKWIYIPTGDQDKPKLESGRLLVIDAKTLKLHQVIQTSSVPHHINAFSLYDGRNVVMSYTFNWQQGAAASYMGPGSGIWLMDPNDNNRIIGGIRSESLQNNPYLAFAHPDGRHLFVGLPPGPISDPDIRHNLEGSIAVVDMKTWQPIKYYKAGFDPIFAASTADGKYTYFSDGGSDEIFKIDNVAQKIVGVSRSSVHGVYGIVLDWKDEQLFAVEKGEASHNRGKMLGLVDTLSMRPVDNYYIGTLRADHGILHPDPQKNEIWISSNSNFREVVFDIEKKVVKAEVKHTGSTHNGAFVKYTVLPSGDWKGELESDQNGLHNSALAGKQQTLGVTETVYGKDKFPTESGRAISR
jgi:DNA-binding beta-propeller fold protein YncE